MRLILYFLDVSIRKLSPYFGVLKCSKNFFRRPKNESMNSRKKFCPFVDLTSRRLIL